MISKTIYQPFNIITYEKILFLCLIVTSLSSFSPVTSEKGSLSNNEPTIVFEENNYDIYRCRADVYHEGQYVTSTYGFSSSSAAEACARAYQMAMYYVDSRE